MVQAAAYWGPNEGPTGEDAITALTATSDLLELLTGPRTWFRTGERATRPVGQEDLPTVLTEGVNLSDDTPPKVMTSLGRRLRLWDGEEGEGELSTAVEGTSARWRGYAIMEHPDLPVTADAAWPHLQELIHIWRPQTATWTTSKVRMLGIRAGLTAARPHFGLLTWMRDGVEAPFVGGETLRTQGGTLYRFGEQMSDLDAQTAQRVVRID